MKREDKFKKSSFKDEASTSKDDTNFKNLSINKNAVNSASKPLNLQPNKTESLKLSDKEINKSQVKIESIFKQLDNEVESPTSEGGGTLVKIKNLVNESILQEEKVKKKNIELLNTYFSRIETLTNSKEKLVKNETKLKSLELLVESSYQLSNQNFKLILEQVQVWRISTEKYKSVMNLFYLMKNSLQVNIKLKIELYKKYIKLLEKLYNMQSKILKNTTVFRAELTKLTSNIKKIEEGINTASLKLIIIREKLKIKREIQKLLYANYDDNNSIQELNDKAENMIKSSIEGILNNKSFKKLYESLKSNDTIESFKNFTNSLAQTTSNIAAKIPKLENTLTEVNSSNNKLKEVNLETSKSEEVLNLIDDTINELKDLFKKTAIEKEKLNNQKLEQAIKESKFEEEKFENDIKNKIESVLNTTKSDLGGWKIDYENDKDYTLDEMLNILKNMGESIHGQFIERSNQIRNDYQERIQDKINSKEEEIEALNKSHELSKKNLTMKYEKDIKLCEDIINSKKKQ